MGDRRLRTVLGFALLAGVSISVILFLLYLTKLPSWAIMVVFVLLSTVEVSLAPVIYKNIYESRWIDLPPFLRRRYLPLGFDAQGNGENPNYDVILLRPSSAVLSAPDSGEALGLGYLASVLRREGLRVLVIDARLMGLDPMQVVELLLMYKTPMLGVNLNFQYIAPSLESLIASLRKRGYPSHITLGGLYASVAYEEIIRKMPGVDTIVRFEGEQTYLELVNAVHQPEKWEKIQSLVYRQNGQVVMNPLRPLIKDLGTIPEPARDHLHTAMEIGGYAYVISSRGCNGVCAYCVQQRSVSDPKGSRWRGRDPEEVADEMEHLHKKFGIRMFSLVDDDIFGSSVNGKTHAERVAEALIRKNLDLSILLSVQPRDITYEIFTILKKAGVDSVILAVDNFAQPVLNRYRKMTTVKQNLDSIQVMKDLGIDAYLGIIMFDPWTSLEELIDNFETIQDIPFLRPWQILSKLEVYHGSPITVELEQKGLLKWEGYSARYQFIDSHIQGVYLAIETIMKALHPSLSDLDRFRWGNLSYSDTDEWILKHFKQNLEEINTEYNRQVIGMALEIVKKQAASPEVISPEQLADPQMRRDAEIFNQMTLNRLKDLRKQAKDHRNEAEEDVEQVKAV
jgi:anaerobic magnesium-protoporphyrin IX monomethyl ester cyclase